VISSAQSISDQNVLQAVPEPVATNDELDVFGDKALLSFLTREQRAFLTCQRTSLAVRLVVLTIFFIPVGVLNPIDASWLYAWLAFYICLEVVAVLSERSGTKKVQQQLASLIKYGSKHRLLRVAEVTELPLAEIGRKLVFGAVLGADAGVLLFALYPALLPNTEVGQVMYVGSAIGAAASQLLERWLSALIAPMSRRTKRYLTLVELALARGKGTISELQAHAIREEVQAKYFREDTPPLGRGSVRPPRVHWT
jgi:hypothetical protein